MKEVETLIGIMVVADKRASEALIRAQVAETRAEAAEADRDKLLALLREAREVLQQVPKLARGPSRELWDGIMVDVLAAKRRIDAALDKPYVDPLDGTRAVDAEGNRL